MLVVSLNSELIGLGLKKIFEYTKQIELVCVDQIETQNTYSNQTLYIIGLSKCNEEVFTYLQAEQCKAIILLDTKFDRPQINKLLRASINGFLSLESSKEEIFKCIEQMEKGLSHFPQEISNLFVTDTVKLNQFKLSERECEILELLSQGKTLQEISDDLFLSKNTVVTHKRNVLKKTGFNKMTQLVAWWRGAIV